ncbi:MAG: High-affinity heme uptake system protein IsdE precursor [Lentisphaerae bacterium ADurb.Bin242]|nr:MAG: High-affinity heme uptake system protein IsdE precursor [Lentisphaerae bacterium ADurb.Bin242]
MKHLLWISVLGIIPLLLPAEIVREDAGSITYRQPDQQEITVKKHPRRVVIGYGSLAKVWDLAGGTAIAVPGVAEKNALPEGMRNLPVIGAATVPNTEKVMAMKPDLVLLIGRMEWHRSIAELLRGSGIDAVCVEYNNYGDFNDILDFFCRINGKTVRDIPSARKVQEDVESICAKTKGLTPPTCAIIFASTAGFSLESPWTNTGMMAEKLGARNVMRGKERSRIHFSYERLLLDNPDAIFVITMGDARALREKFDKEFTTQPAWNELKAARGKRVHFLPVEWFLYMPGPDYPKAFRRLAELLYPGAPF